MSPVGQATPAARSRRAGQVLEALVRQREQLLKKDVDFVQSLHDAPRLSAKQVLYVIGEEATGKAPNGLPALENRYSYLLTASEPEMPPDPVVDAENASQVGLSNDERLEIDGMTPQEIEDELDVAYEFVDRNIDMLTSNPRHAYMRLRYLQLTDRERDEDGLPHGEDPNTRTQEDVAANMADATGDLPF